MKQEKEKIVLAYSGGLDTSVAIAWLKNKGYDVIACCIDVGEGKDLEAIKAKGSQVGAYASVVIDAKEDFAENFVLPALQSNAMYEQSPYSIDENLWGRANECGILEDPWASAPEDAYDRTNPIEKTPDTPEIMEIQFAHGKPVALNGEAMPLAELIMKLDKIAGKHGIGRIDHVENRLVGIKSREIYECPAATVLLKAHKDLEDLTLEREAAHFKPVVELKMANLIYNGLWYSPLMKAIQAFIKETQKDVNGTVRVKLFKGNVVCEGRKSPNSLYDKNLATYTSADEFDQEAAGGFIKLWELPDKVYAQVQANAAKNQSEPSVKGETISAD